MNYTQNIISIDDAKKLIYEANRAGSKGQEVVDVQYIDNSDASTSHQSFRLVLQYRNPRSGTND